MVKKGVMVSCNITGNVTIGQEVIKIRGMVMSVKECQRVVGFRSNGVGLAVFGLKV